MTMEALNIGLRDAYCCSIRGRFSCTSSSGIADLHYVVFIFVAYLACETDSRSLEVVKWELEPRTGLEIVVRSARIIVRLGHSLCSPCDKGSSLRLNVKVGHVDKGADDISPVFFGVC